MANNIARNLTYDYVFAQDGDRVTIPSTLPDYNNLFTQRGGWGAYYSLSLDLPAALVVLRSEMNAALYEISDNLTYAAKAPLYFPNATEFNEFTSKFGGFPFGAIINFGGYLYISSSNSNIEVPSGAAAYTITSSRSQWRQLSDHQNNSSYKTGFFGSSCAGASFIAGQSIGNTNPYTAYGNNTIDFYNPQNSAYSRLQHNSAEGYSVTDPSTGYSYRTIQYYYVYSGISGAIYFASTQSVQNVYNHFSGQINSINSQLNNIYNSISQLSNEIYTLQQRVNSIVSYLNNQFYTITQSYSSGYVPDDSSVRIASTTVPAGYTFISGYTDGTDAVSFEFVGYNGVIYLFVKNTNDNQLSYQSGIAYFIFHKNSSLTQATNSEVATLQAQINLLKAELDTLKTQVALIQQP